MAKRYKRTDSRKRNFPFLRSGSLRKRYFRDPNHEEPFLGGRRQRTEMIHGLAVRYKKLSEPDKLVLWKWVASYERDFGELPKDIEGRDIVVIDPKTGEKSIAKWLLD